jgi:prepilin-type N-terminal cleavage/methylation domain-containing protein
MLNRITATGILEMGTNVTCRQLGVEGPPLNAHKRLLLARFGYGVRVATPTTRGHAGFTITELSTALAVLLILSAIVIPTAATMLREYRATGDVRRVVAQAALARMRAAANFTTARLNFDLAANTYQVEIWDKAANGGLGAYRAEGAVQTLSEGIGFGYKTVTLPAGGQTTIAQPSPSQITFNSRGHSVDDGGTAIGTAVIYLNDAHNVWAISVSLAGQVTAAVYDGSIWRPL